MATEKRLIDANALIEKFRARRDLFVSAWIESKEMPPKDKARVDELGMCIAETINAPTVDAVEVVHGQWRKVYTCHGEQTWGYECDQCKADNPRASYYCPHCGAKMDGDGDA